MKITDEIAEAFELAVNRTMLGYDDEFALKDFVPLIAAQEREACAKVAEGFLDPDDTSYPEVIAAAIRARAMTDGKIAS